MNSPAEIGHLLREWYEANARPLPWRENRDPYRIWLSETILQQTRIAQGIPYYVDFTASFPSIRHLAEASPECVMRHWQGLGYYSRARNLHRCAQEVMDRYQGLFPADYDALRSLPGIGPYTAAAIASIAFDLPYPVVDGNVLRVLARLFDLEGNVLQPAVRKQMERLAEDLLDREHPGLYNQAIMELGETVCTPRQSRCEACPIAGECLALHRGTVDLRPCREKKTERRQRVFHYLVLFHGDSVFLRRREGKDIWMDLWEFPLWETETDNGAVFPTVWQDWLLRGERSPETARLTHQLSHQTITAYFHVLRSRSDWSALADDTWTSVPVEALTALPLPRLISRFLESLNP